MLVTTEALVLSKTNYSETSLIVRCYTRSDGIKSYIIKGGKQGRKGNKTTALFQPLHQLEITAHHKNKSGLSIPKSIKMSKPYQTIPFQMDKIAVVLFLSEVLSSALREEEANASLFHYLTSSLSWFDMQDDVANFHIFFCYPSPSIWDFFQMYVIKTTPILIWKMAALASKKVHNRLMTRERFQYSNRFLFFAIY